MSTDAELASEAALHDFQSRIAQLEALHEADQLEVTALRRSEDEATSQLSSLKGEQAKLEHRLERQEEEARAAQSTRERVEGEKRELLEALARSDADKLQLDESNASLRTALASSQSSLRTLQGTHSALIETDRSNKLRLQALQGEVEILRKDRDWHQSELQRISEERASERRDKNAQITRLQTQLDTASSSLESNTTALTSLRTAHAALEAQLSTAQASVADLTGQLAESEASFRSEMATSQRLNQLLERREEETRLRLTEVEKEWKAAQAEMDVARATYESEVAEERRRGDALEDRVTELRDFADRLAAGNASLDGLPQYTSPRQSQHIDEDVFGSPMPQSPRSSTMLGSASTLAMKLQRSGAKSYTDLYTAYVKSQDALELERAEVTRLGQCLNDILAEISERAPLLREQRGEWERALAENNQLSVALVRALEAKDVAERLAEDRRLQLDTFQAEHTLQSQQLDDTCRQVRVLAKRVAVLQDPTILDRSDDQDDLGKGSNNSASDIDVENADTYISAHLVTFASIDDLQRQNANLLKIVRRLGNRMEADEASRYEKQRRAENVAVEEAHDLILRLKDEVQSQRAQLAAQTRERDMLRQLVKSGDSAVPSDDQQNSSPRRAANGTSSDSGHLQQEFENYKTEMAVDARSLREDLASARREASQLSISLARAEAQRDMQQQRYQSLEESHKRQSRDLADAERRSVQLQINMSRQDEATRHATESLLELRASLERLRHENVILTAEKQVWKNVETRLTEDNAALAAERSHLANLIHSVQSMHNELERSDADGRKRLEDQLGRLQAELEITKARLIQEQDALRQSSLRAEAESRDLQSRLNKIATEHSEAREALLTSKHEYEHAQQKAEVLARQTAAYEEKLAVYEGRRVGSTASGSSQTREQELEAQIAELRADLGAARVGAEQARGHVEQYKAIAQAHEETLAELNSTYETYKTGMEATAAKKEAEIENLRGRVESLTADVSSANDEVSALHRSLEDQRSQFTADQQSNTDVIANLQRAEAEFSTFRIALQADFDAQKLRAQEAHDKYQNELVSHADDVRTMSLLKAELQNVQMLLDQARLSSQTAENSLTSSQASWKEQISVLQSELDEQRKRATDLTSQNSILHNHLQEVSAQAATLKPLATGPASEVGEVETDLSVDLSHSTDLQAVVRYIRREKEVAELRLELSRQQEARYKQQLDHANRLLDERTLELSKEQQRAAGNDLAAAQHADLLEKIRNMNLLRESNETLRRDNERHVQRLQDLDEKLREAESTLGPLREQVRLASVEIEARDRNIKLLEEDNARWKTRTQQILQKYERIDPAELAQLKEELDVVRGSLQTLQKEHAALELRANAITVDMDDANNRAEASAQRFKQLQQVARRHRDEHTAATAQAETTRAELDAKVKSLTENKADLENRIKELEEDATTRANTVAMPDPEALSELTKEKEHLQNAQQEAEAAKKKLEEEIEGLTKRNSLLLNDNKRFRAQIADGQNKLAEVEKNMATQIETAVREAQSGANVIDDKSDLAALEQKHAQAQEAAVEQAIQRIRLEVQSEYEQKIADLRAAQSDTEAGELPSGIDEAEAQRRVETAVRQKEEEMSKSAQARLDDLAKNAQNRVDTVKKQVEMAMQTQIDNLVKSHKSAKEALERDHNAALSKAVGEARQSAAAAAGQDASDSAVEERITLAVKQAVEALELTHKTALAEKTAEVETMAKQQFELKGKLRESQITALRKEVTTLKAKLADATGSAVSASPISATPTTPTVKTTTPSTPGAAAQPHPTPGSSPKGLSIAGRSSSQSKIVSPVGLGRGAGLSIVGTAAGTTTNATESPQPNGGAGTPTAARGRGRGGRGRGRGAIVSSAMAAATENAPAKRTREEENGDTEAKRRKEGPS